MKRLFISILITLLLGIPFAKGASYYVSLSGDDGNSGELSAPYATIQKAVDMCASGNDQIYVRGGTYNQTVYIANKSGITLTRYGSENAYVQGNSAISNAIINIANSSNITVSYLYVQNLNVNWAKGILVIGSGTNIQIVGNKINNIHYKAGSYDASDNPGSNIGGANPIEIVGDNSNASLNQILISGNEVYNCMTGWSEGIAVKGNVENFNIELNTVHDITNIGIDAFGLGTYPALTQNTQARSGSIQRNLVYNCKCNYTDNGGIYVDGGKDIAIVNNTVHSNLYGITIGCENQMNLANGTTSGIHVRNNFVYNNARAGIMIGTSGDDDGLQGNVAYCSVMGNTFLKNSTSSQWGSEAVIQNCNDITFSSNIFYALYNQMFTYNLGTSNIAFNYNNYYYLNGNEGSVVVSQQVNSSTWTGITLSEFKNLVGGDPGSIFANPLLVSDNPSNGNFHINTNSPCVNMGDPSYSVLVGELDMDLTSRISAGRIDMGCDETGSSSGTVYVTGVSVSPTSLNLSVGSNQQLSKIITPSNATNQNVTWSSSNSSVASVNSAGEVTGLSAGTATVTVTTIDGGFTSSCFITVTSSSSLPSPWTSSDIGTVAATGSANYTNGTFTIAGSGADVWGTSDEFRYVYQQISGDATITARIVSLENTDAWAKAGVMIRNGLAANATHAMTVATASNGMAFQRRTTAGGSSDHTAASGSVPYWVRIKRSGNTFTSYISSDGSSWTTVGSVSINMSTSAYVGLMVTSHNDGTLCSANFDNVEVTTSTNIPVTGISLLPTSVSLAIGGSEQLAATVSPNNATNQNASWSSSNTSIATVSSSGLVTAQSTGSTTITVTTQDGGYTAYCTVNVISGGGTNITIDGSLSDWSTISTVASASGQSVSSLKVYDDENYFYFGIAGVGLNSNYQVWLNTDNNASTGYNDWNYTSSGADYMVENGMLRQSTGTGWGWNDIGTVTDSKNSSVTEVRIPRSQLGTLSSTIQVAFSDVNSSWSVVSKLGYSPYTRLKAANNDIHNSEISVYPNPASDIINIDLAGDSNKSTIEIHNINGQLLYRSQTTEDFIRISTDEFEYKGMLIIRVQNGADIKPFSVMVL